MAHSKSTLRVRALQADGGRATDHAPGDRWKFYLQATEIFLLEGIKTMGCVAHLFPFRREEREDRDDSAVLVVVGQSRSRRYCTESVLINAVP